MIINYLWIYERSCAELNRAQPCTATKVLRLQTVRLPRTVQQSEQQNESPRSVLCPCGVSTIGRRAYHCARAAHAFQHVSHPNYFCHFYLFKHIFTVTFLSRPSLFMTTGLHSSWHIVILSNLVWSLHCFDMEILRNVQSASGFVILSGKNKMSVNEGTHRQTRGLSLLLVIVWGSTKLQSSAFRSVQIIFFLVPTCKLVHENVCILS